MNIKYSATHKTFIGAKAASFIHEINHEALWATEKKSWRGEKAVIKLPHDSVMLTELFIDAWHRMAWKKGRNSIYMLSIWLCKSIIIDCRVSDHPIIDSSSHKRESNMSSLQAALSSFRELLYSQWLPMSHYTTERRSYFPGSDAACKSEAQLPADAALFCPRLSLDSTNSDSLMYS